MIIAGTCIAVAAGFMLVGNFSTAFVIATIGIVAWFLNYRMQMKELTAPAELDHKQKESEDPNEP